MQGERLAGGLWCREVQARLSDYLDGELGPAGRRQVDEHLAACDVCERFGGEFAAAVKAIREELAPAPPLDAAVETRLRDRLTAAGR